MPNLFLIFLCLCAASLVLPTLLDFLETKLVYRDDRYGVARAKVVDAEMSRGASYTEAQETLFLREMMARVRREASDAVRGNPALWLEHIETAREGAAAEIAAYKPHLVSRFRDSVGTLPYTDILYPHEANIVDRSSTKLMRAVSPSADEWAAVTIRR
jgi:hypothetical protein